MLIMGRQVVLFRYSARLPHPAVYHMVGQRFLQLRSATCPQIVEYPGPRLKMSPGKDAIELGTQVLVKLIVFIDTTHRADRGSIIGIL
jgi:hypothetical protein